MLHELSEKRKTLLEWGIAGVAAVDAKRCVERALRRHAPVECAVLALGKAAVPMAHGAQAARGGGIRTGLVVAPRPEPVPAGQWTLLQGAHPVPDEHSIEAGDALARWLRQLPPGLPLLVLLSGGSSALVEWPVQGLGLETLQRINRWLLASGLDIRAMNRVRARFSQLKRGGLLRAAGRRKVTGLIISDVPGDAFEDIGSGPLSPLTAEWPEDAALPDWLHALHRQLPLPPRAAQGDVTLELLASNTGALDAVAARVREHGLPVIERAPLGGDAAAAGRVIARRLLAGPAGVYLFGGETVMTLPEAHGRGGRNQHLALAAAETLDGNENVLLLALATDGVDGSTEDAGALVDGGTAGRVREAGLSVPQALACADSNAALAAAGDLVHTGPTGTNVADLVIGWKFA